MCSARRLMVFNVCVKFHKNVSSGFKVMERTRKIVNTKRAITQKVDESELRFMCSARRLMVFNVCVKFHENMSSGFKVMERTRKLLTDTHTHTHTHTHTQKRQKHYTPMAGSHFVQWSKTILAIFVESHSRNISMKLF